METRNEIWKDIEGYEGYYQVSNFGRVRSVEHVITLHLKNGRTKPLTVRDRIISQAVLRNGYKIVTLRKALSAKTISVHRIVAKAFVPGYQEGLQVNHKDENKKNNCAWNLEWVTPRENVVYSLSRSRRMINSPRIRPVIQMTMDGKIVKRWESINEAYRELGLHRGCIREACKDKNRTSGGYRWRFAND